MKLEKYYDRIDLYHAGELSEEDRQSFEQELQANEALRQADDLYRASMEVLDFGIEQQLRQDLKNWAKEAPKIQETVPAGGAKIVSLRQRWFTLGAAASVLLLIFFAWYLLQPAPSPEDLFSDHYKTPNYSTLRGGGQAPDALNAAKTELAEGHYADALHALSRISATDPLYVEAQFYLGHALIGLNNFNRAKDAFEIVALSNDNKLKDKGEWYYLLVCLRAKQWDDRCRAKLQAIAQQADHSYYRDANQLLKAME